jgi:cell division protein ZapD
MIAYSSKPVLSIMKNTIIYDQPLNEVIRVCLRLEQLFQQIDHQLFDESTFGSRNLIVYIINVLHILERPDLKAKLAKELAHLQTYLLRFGTAPDADTDKIAKLTEELNKLSRSMIETSGKIGYRLRDIELLNTLRLHLASPGGGCSFDLPLFHCWLQQPAHQRQATIKGWLTEFHEIRAAATLVLELVRNNAKIDEKTAVHGFHQELLDPQSNLRMIRIGIHHNLPVFPEISIGRHFLSVRIFTLDIDNKPQQYTQNVPFWIAYCNA